MAENYSSKSNNLDDLVSLNNIVDKYRDYRTPPREVPNFDADYERMKRLAEEGDDFKQVIKIFESILERSRGLEPQKAIGILRESHRLYSESQKMLAKLFGDRGQFDLAETHLENAGIGLEFRIGFDPVVLEPRISSEEVDEIIGNAIRKTPPEYFLTRVVSSSEEGDIGETKKYASLSLRSLKERGLINIPDGESSRHQFDDSKFEAFIRVQRALGRMHVKSYESAVRKKFEEAVGRAVNKPPIYSDKIRVDQLRKESQDLFLDSVNELVPGHRRPEAFSETIDFFNRFLNPLYDGLLECCEDQDHPLRTIYRSVREGDHSWGRIKGSERIVVETSALVPREFYKGRAPVLVHPFFNPLIERSEGK